MSDIADWYDRNTRWFVTVARGRAAGSIHRELWGPDVTDVVEALQHVNALILAHLPKTPTPRLLDLGCGVGGSLRWMLEAVPTATGVGLTISSAQVALALERLTAAGLAERARVLQADFTAPPALAPVNLAFSIEAYVHGTDPAAFFAAAASCLAPGGRLVVVDDVLTRPREALTPAEAAVIERFTMGWRLGSLDTAAAVARVAAAAGLSLIEDRDLTPMLRLMRPRDRWVRFWVQLLGGAPIRHPYWHSLVGGDALQTGLSTRTIAYRLLAFAKET